MCKSSSGEGGVCRATGIDGDLIAYLTSIVPTTMPVIMPMVASPSPIWSRSPTPCCWRTGVRPARVPCPRANDISMSAAALLSIPNTGSSRNQTQIPPSANLTHRHHADHDDVRARDAPNRPERRQGIAQEERGGHDGDQHAGHLLPHGEYIIWKDPAPTEDPAHPLRAEPEDEKTADHCGRHEQFAQRS